MSPSHPPSRTIIAALGIAGVLAAFPAVAVAEVEKLTATSVCEAHELKARAAAPFTPPAGPVDVISMEVRIIEIPLDCTLFEDVDAVHDGNSYAYRIFAANACGEETP